MEAKCAACKKPREFNSSFCLDDKRALDRIRFQCKQAGQAEQKWWRDEQNKGIQAVVVVLQTYWTQ
eukprot:2408139-Amphidinium_carterae.1